MNLAGHDITATLPRHWEGAIVRQSPVQLESSSLYALGRDGTQAPRDASAAATAERTTALASLPVLHLANFPLPAQRGDFGSGAVDLMGASDVFVSLLEYGAENIGTPLFAHSGPPRALRLSDFHPLALQRPLPGQVGYQEFFTTAGRAFCLYVVLGSATTARRLLGDLNTILANIEIGPSQ